LIAKSQSKRDVQVEQDSTHRKKPKLEGIETEEHQHEDKKEKMEEGEMEVEEELAKGVVGQTTGNLGDGENEKKYGKEGENQINPKGFDDATENRKRIKVEQREKQMAFFGAIGKDIEERDEVQYLLDCSIALTKEGHYISKNPILFKILAKKRIVPNIQECSEEDLRAIADKLQILLRHSSPDEDLPFIFWLYLQSLGFDFI